MEVSLPPVTVAVIGSRTFNNYVQFCQELDQLARTMPLAGLVSGGATGADALAEQYARERQLPLTVFRPDYARYGRRAPLLRNAQVVEAATLVLAFWDGRSKGTAHALRHARRVGVATIVVVPERPT